VASPFSRRATSILSDGSVISQPDFRAAGGSIAAEMGLTSAAGAVTTRAVVPAAQLFPKLKEDLRCGGGGGDAQRDECHFLESFAVDALGLGRHVLGFSGDG